MQQDPELMTSLISLVNSFPVLAPFASVHGDDVLEDSVGHRSNWNALGQRGYLERRLAAKLTKDVEEEELGAEEDGK